VAIFLNFNLCLNPEKEMEMKGKKRTHNGIEISELKKENGVSTIFTNKQR